MSLESIDMGNPNQDYVAPEPVLQQTAAMLSKFAADANKTGKGLEGVNAKAPKSSFTNSDPISSLSGDRSGSKQDIHARRQNPGNKIDGMGLERGYWAQKSYAKQMQKRPKTPAYGFGAKSGLDAMGNKLPNRKPIVITAQTIENSGINSGPIGYIKAQRGMAHQQKANPNGGALIKGALDNKADAKNALDNQVSASQLQDFMEGKPKHVQEKLASIYGANRVVGDKLAPPKPGGAPN